MLNTSKYKGFLIPFLLSSMLCLFPISGLSAGDRRVIDYLPASGDFIGQEERQTGFYYHNNTLDQLWYGPDAWAVKFDFADIPAVESFSVEAVSIYFPQSEGDFNLSIYLNDLQPLDTLAVTYSNITADHGWNTLQLAPEDQFNEDVFWVVVEYGTSHDQNRYMGSSALGGEQSYFWVPPENDDIPGYFSNMAENNISAEFLFTVSGTLHFEEEGYDLELKTFRFLGNMEPAGNIYPKFTVQNNSPEAVNELIGLSVQLTNPDEEDWNVTIPLDLSLAAGADTTFVMDIPQYTYELLETSSQYRLRAELQFDDDLYPPNDLITFSFDTFTLEREQYLLEFFLQSDNQASIDILDVQQDLSDESLSFINYFFNAADEPYYTPEAAIKKDFYSLTGYPFTVVEGTKKTAGYFPGYADSLSAALDPDAAKTCLTLLDDTVMRRLDPEDFLMQLEFTIANESAYLFSDNAANLRMDMALVEHVTGDEYLNGSHLIHLFRYEPAETIELGLGQHYNFSWTHNLQTVETISREMNLENLEYFEIIYWLQDNIKKDIYFAGSFFPEDFDLVPVSVDDPYQDVSSEVPVIDLYPNPVRYNSQVTFSVTATRETKEFKIEIYNIKGQLVKELSPDPGFSGREIVWNGLNSQGKRISSGVYFARLETFEYSGRQHSKYRKFVVLP